MMKAQALKLIVSYDTDDPEALSRQLGQLEANVAETLASVGQVHAVAPKPTNRKTTTYAAKLGEMVLVDTTAGNAAVTLPVSSPQNAGQTIVVVMLSASNTCNVSCVDGSSTINQGPLKALSGAIGVTVFWSTGIGWYA